MATDDADSNVTIRRDECVDDSPPPEEPGDAEVGVSACPVCGHSESVVHFEQSEFEQIARNPEEADEAGEVDESDEAQELATAASPISDQQNPARRHLGTILRCKKCKLGYREVRPDEATLSKFYEEQDVEPLLSEIPGRRWTARRHWELVKPLMLKGHVLDVGCGSGLFLEQVGRGGWTGTGIEPSPVLCKHAREQMNLQITVIDGTLEASGFPPRLFDVVTLWNVLEHTPKPAEFLRASTIPLKPGGYVLLSVPYFDSTTAQLLGPRWPNLLPEHLNYFSRKSLHRCAEASGLNLVRFTHRTPIRSLGHVARGLAAQQIPLASGLGDLFSSLRIEDWLVPAPMGDIVAIFQKPDV